MSDLINEIQRAQMLAGEQAVIDRLEKLGLDKTALEHQQSRIKDYQSACEQKQEIINGLQEQVTNQQIIINLLIETLSPFAECHLPPEDCWHRGVTAHFSSRAILAAKNAIKNPEDLKCRQ